MCPTHSYVPKPDKYDNRMFVLAERQCVVTEAPKQLQAFLSLPVDGLCSSLPVVCVVDNEGSKTA